MDCTRSNTSTSRINSKYSRNYTQRSRFRRSFSSMEQKFTLSLRNRTASYVFYGNNTVCFFELISLTFPRFVNGLVDVEQKQEYAKSIYLLADKIGLPRTFVDIRHQATHSQLPSIPVLRKSCNEVIQQFL